MSEQGYPYLSRPAMLFGFPRRCTELGGIGGYVAFYLFESPLYGAIFGLILLLVTNRYLKKDPQYFTLIRKIRGLPRHSQAYFRNKGSRVIFVERTADADYP